MNRKHFLWTWAVLTFSTLLVCGCGAEKPDTILNDPEIAQASDSPIIRQPPIPMVPQGVTLYTGKNAPILRYVAPQGPAAKAGLMPEDILLRLNDKRVYTAADFEDNLHFAPRHSSVTFRRAGKTLVAPIILENERPRLGALFEPVAIPLVKLSAPYIAVMHVNDITLFAETSRNEKKGEIHLNLIMQSMKPLPVAQMNYTVTEIGSSKLLAKGFENIDALSSDSKIFSKIIHEDGKLKGPIKVSVNIEQNHFHFEFQ